jgi:hypothetical protein
LKNPKKRGNFRKNFSPLSDVSNTLSTHHIDCFSNPSIDDSPKHKDHTILPLSASKEPESCLHGFPSENPNPTRSRSFGSNLNNSETNEEEFDEEQARVVEAAITMALFTQDFVDNEAPTFVVENINSDNDKIKPFSKTQIVPGADTPMLIINIGTIQGVKHQRPLRALVDSGSKRSFIYSSVLPKEVIPTTLEQVVNTKLLD